MFADSLNRSPCVAVIADLVQSRRLAPSHRSATQSTLEKILLDHLRRGATQVEMSRLLGVSRQVISKQVKAAAWTAYCDGEDGWRTALARFITSENSSTA